MFATYKLKNINKATIINKVLFSVATSRTKIVRTDLRVPPRPIERKRRKKRKAKRRRKTKAKRGRKVEREIRHPVLIQILKTTQVRQ